MQCRAACTHAWTARLTDLQGRLIKAWEGHSCSRRLKLSGGQRAFNPISCKCNSIHGFRKKKGKVYAARHHDGSLTHQVAASDSANIDMRATVWKCPRLTHVLKGREERHGGEGPGGGLRVFGALVFRVCRKGVKWCPHVSNRFTESLTHSFFETIAPLP